MADAFVALPGGLGTLEEFTEIWTWGQLGLHRKPYGLLNVAGFYTPLLEFLDHALAQGFVRPEHRAMVRVAEDPAALLDAMEHAPPPALPEVPRSRHDLSRSQLGSWRPERRNAETTDDAERAGSTALGVETRAPARRPLHPRLQSL